MKNNISLIIVVCNSYRVCYISTNSLKTISVATFCIIVDEVMNADSLPTDKH
jgi:hypothetical protein